MLSQITKKEIPIHFINFTYKENNADIKNMKVSVESPHKKQGLVKCVCRQSIVSPCTKNCIHPSLCCIHCGENQVTAYCNPYLNVN